MTHPSSQFCPTFRMATEAARICIVSPLDVGVAASGWPCATSGRLISSSNICIRNSSKRMYCSALLPMIICDSTSLMFFDGSRMRHVFGPRTR